MKDPFRLYADHQNRLKRSTPIRKKNTKPEKEVERHVLEWLRVNNFDVNIVESKAVFNPKIGRYLSSMSTPGMSDVIGNDRNGKAVYIELKAKGKINTLRENQFEFLKRKILTNCFAVVIDDVEKLSKYYNHWISLSIQAGREYLLELLSSYLA